MEINAEKLHERIKELEVAREQHIAQLHAISGAIGELQKLLAPTPAEVNKPTE